jgi:pimeloyl-ACP methyl ester carboxylesterase
MFSGRLLTVICLIASVFVLGFSAVAQDSETPYIEWSDCPFEVPEDETEGETIDCGVLVTYEDHFSDDDAAQVEIAFAILYSNAESAPDPVIYLEGGPGGSALTGISDWAESSVRENNDLILLDQRGTGYSLPSLNCIEIEEPEDDDPLVAEQACFDRFVEEGINLNAYNSLQSATDINELMALLQEEFEYSAFNLLGISYGTRLALTLMRDHPDNIRSVILDSVYPPNRDAYEHQGINQYRGLQMLFDGCAADLDCDSAYPELDAVFYDIYESLNGSPAAYQSLDEETGELTDEELTGDSFLDLIVESLYSTDTIPELPLVIYEVSEGNYDVVAMIGTGELSGGFQRQDDSGDISDSEGAFNAVECYEELPFNDFDEAVEVSAEIPEPIHDFLVAGIENQFLICQLYRLDQADPVETEPVYSDIPTLVLAGDYDPITPPEDAQLAAETLSTSYYFEFPGFGHGITDQGDCAKAIIAEFLADPSIEPDGSCINNLVGPAFVTR